MSHLLYLMLKQNSIPVTLTAREHSMLIIIRIASQYFYRTIRVNSVYCKFNLNFKKNVPLLCQVLRADREIYQ